MMLPTNAQPALWLDRMLHAAVAASASEMIVDAATDQYGYAIGVAHARVNDEIIRLGETSVELLENARAELRRRTHAVDARRGWFTFTSPSQQICIGTIYEGRTILLFHTPALEEFYQVR